MNDVSYRHKAKAEKCASLLTEWQHVYSQNSPPCEVVWVSEPIDTSTLRHFAVGIGTMQIFPMTEPKNVFDIPWRSVTEAIERDWYAVGDDIWKVIIREMSNELKDLNASGSRVESTKPTETESAWTR